MSQGRAMDGVLQKWPKGHGRQSAEDDTPAFIDLQSLRNLAAGKTGWKYVPKKSRKAAKTRVDVIDIAKTRDPGLAREVKAPCGFERESYYILL